MVRQSPALGATWVSGCPHPNPLPLLCPQGEHPDSTQESMYWSND